MEFSRRKLLKYSSAGLIISVAGCAEDEVVSDPTQGGTTVQTTQEDTFVDRTETTTSQETEPETEATTETSSESVAELGETLVYTAGDQELAFTVSEASLHDAIVTTFSNMLTSTVPENRNHTFLRIKVQLENRGDERVRSPGSLLFSLDGTQYEPSITVSTDNRYESYNEILPGNSTSGWLTFAIPPKQTEGRLIVDFSTFGDAVTGKWIIDVGELNRVSYDFSGKSIGEAVTFGTETTQFQVSASEIEETQSYTYSSGDFEFEAEAGDGNKFLLVTVRAENTGETVVDLPSTFDMNVRTGASQFESGLYRGENAYEGGEVSPGIQREGKVQFEVPQSASSYEFQINLTDDITATWEV